MFEFTEKLGIYSVATQMGKGVLPERHPRYIACTALSANDIVHVAVEQADRAPSPPPSYRLPLHPPPHVAAPPTTFAASYVSVLVCSWMFF